MTESINAAAPVLDNTPIAELIVRGLSEMDDKERGRLVWWLKGLIKDVKGAQPGQYDQRFRARLCPEDPYPASRVKKPPLPAKPPKEPKPVKTRRTIRKPRKPRKA